MAVPPAPPVVPEAGLPAAFDPSPPAPPGPAPLLPPPPPPPRPPPPPPAPAVPGWPGPFTAPAAPAAAARAPRAGRGVHRLTIVNMKQRGLSRAILIRLGIPVARAADDDDETIATRPAGAIDDLLDDRREVRGLVGDTCTPVRHVAPRDRRRGLGPAGDIEVRPSAGKGGRIVTRLGFKGQAGRTRLGLRGGEFDIGIGNRGPLGDRDILKSDADCKHKNLTVDHIQVIGVP